MPSFRERPWFWVGFVILSCTVFPILAIFLGAISWGILLFPLMFLIVLSPLFLIDYFTRRRSSCVKR
jgi:hypothetical protein